MSLIYRGLNIFHNTSHLLHSKIKTFTYPDVISTQLLSIPVALQQTGISFKSESTIYTYSRSGDSIWTFGENARYHQTTPELAFRKISLGIYVECILFIHPSVMLENVTVLTYVRLYTCLYIVQTKYEIYIYNYRETSAGN